MALHKVDSALDSLRHYTVSGTRIRPAAQGSDTSFQVEKDHSATVAEHLRQLREALIAVRRARDPALTMQPLKDCWDNGSWFPVQLLRRIAVNQASTGLALLRATAVEDVSLRARPTQARLDADVSVIDSPVFNVARYAGTMNLVVIGVLAGFLRFHPFQKAEDLPAELLATILTLFSAVLAGRVEHPDGSTLRGLLSRASYWLMLASVLPAVLLAITLAMLPGRVADAALVALIFQALLVYRLRQGPLSGWRRGRRPRITLTTPVVPDHARFDVLRGSRSRALVTEALLLGREAYAYVVARPAEEDQFLGLLERTQSMAGRAEERLSWVTNPRAVRALRAITERGERMAEGVLPGLSVGGPANLLGAVQSATAGRAMTYLIFRERPADGWPPTGTDPDVVVRPVPLDPDRLAPMETPEWVLEVLIGIPESVVTMPIVDHPLLAVLRATRRYNFWVMGVQLPAPPPPGGAGRRWMRLKIGITYRRGDSLRGLGGFLYHLHQMDDAPLGAGTLSVVIRVNSERARMAARPGARSLSDRDFDVVPDAEAAADPSRSWRALAITGHARVGLLYQMLAGLAVERPSFALAGMRAETLLGQTVVFVVGRDTGGDEGRPLALALPERARRSDRLVVALDRRSSPRSLDGAPDTEDRLLVLVALRCPDRPGVLRETLRHLQRALAEHAPPGVPVQGLDVWFVQNQVVNGRTTRARVTVRLPGSQAHWPHWQAVDWASVERSVGRAAARAAHGDGANGTGRVAGLTGRWASPALDDTVVTVDLLRTSTPSALPSP
jgi:hypothetical protein